MEIPKWEMMQYVKTVLVRHGVDLSLLDFSVSKTTVYLSGLLRKDPSGDFTAAQLTAMLKELTTALPIPMALQIELANWDVHESYGEWLVRQRRVELGGAPAEEE